MSSPRAVAFEILSERPDPQAPFISALFAQRFPMLVNAARALGAREGCRIRDDLSGFDFRWRLVP